MTGQADLETVIREQLSRVVANALTAGVPSAGMMNRATETILRTAGETSAHLAESLKFTLYRPPRNGPGGGTGALDVVPLGELLAALREA